MIQNAQPLPAVQGAPGEEETPEIRQNASALAAADSMLLVLRADGRIDRINPAGSVISGFSAQEIVGRTIWAAILIAEDVTNLRSALDQLRAGKASVSLETYVLTKHGERRRVAWVWTALPAPAGHVEYFVGTGIDVTMLAELRDDYRRAFESAAADRNILAQLRQQLQREQNASAGGPRVDRRSEVRRGYPYRQSIAPIIEGRHPAETDFQSVLCHELSSRGCSYLVTTPPSYQELIIVFGAPPNLTRLIAEVRHFTPLDRGGQTMYLVGCRFKGKAN